MNTLNLIKHYQIGTDINPARSHKFRWRAVMPSSVKDKWNLVNRIDFYAPTIEEAVSGLFEMENQRVTLELERQKNLCLPNMY